MSKSNNPGVGVGGRGKGARYKTTHYRAKSSQDAFYRHASSVNLTVGGSIILRQTFPLSHKV